MLSKTYNKILLTLMLTVGFLSGCSGGGGSSNDPKPLPSPVVPKTSTQYEFSVDSQDPTVVNTQANTSPLVEYPVYVVSVNANGLVTEQAIEVVSKTFSSGQYTLKLLGDASVETSIIIDTNRLGQPSVGKELSPQEYLYYPAVESNEAFVISLKSTVIYDIFLNIIKSFENISTEELDTIIDKAILLVSNIEGKSGHELISSIRNTVKVYVETNTLLAAATVDVPSTALNATIEEDRAEIKSFFNELNSLYVLYQDIVNAPEEEENSQLRELADSALTIQDTVQAGASAYEALDTVVEIFSDFFAMIKPTSNDQIKDLSTLFENDAKSTLTGKITYNSSQAKVTLSGRYDAVVFTNLTIVLDATSNLNNVQASVSGTIESPTARLEINKAEITATSDLVSSGVFASENAASEFGNGLNAAIAEMDVNLSTKGSKVAIFNGKLRVTGVRSTDSYIEFAVANDEEVEAQSFYNYEFASVEGTLTIGTSSVHVQAEAISDNALNYVPKTQKFISGQNYNNIFNYDFNGTDEFILRSPDQVETYKLKTQDRHSLYIYNSNGRTESSLLFGGTFDELLQQRLSDDINVESVSYDLDFNNFVKTEDNRTQKYYVSAGSESGDLLEINYIYTDQLFRYSYVEYSSLKEISYMSLGGNEYQEVVINAYNQNNNGINFISFSDHINASNHEHWSSLDFGFYDAADCYSYYRMPPNYQFIEGINAVTLTRTSHSDCEGENTISISYSFDSDLHFKWDINNEYKHADNIEYYFYSAEIAPSDILISTYLYSDGDSSSFGYFLPNNKTFVDEITQRYVVNDRCLAEYNCYHKYKSVKNVGDFKYAFTSLEIGKNVSISALLLNADSLIADESKDNFRSGRAKATITTVLDGLGKTIIDATAFRTGLEDGVFTLSIDHSDIIEKKTAIRFVGSMVDGDLKDLVVNSDSGFSLSRGDIEFLNDNLQMTYGRETALVSKTGLGIKVTYSDGSFNNY